LGLIFVEGIKRVLKTLTFMVSYYSQFEVIMNTFMWCCDHRNLLSKLMIIGVGESCWCVEYV